MTISLCPIDQYFKGISTWVGGSNSLRRLVLNPRLRLYRQLQHRRALAYAQMREQHDLTIRELKRIVMGAWIFQVDLSEPSDLVNEGPPASPRKC
jgi:hypothetical protein